MVGSISGTKKPQMDIKTSVTTTDTQMRTTAKALLDSGCSKTCIDPSFVEAHQLRTFPSRTVTPVHNADNSINGYIREYVELELEILDSKGVLHREVRDLPIVNLGGKHDIFIGYDWLEEHNPSIDWKERSLTFDHCQDYCGVPEEARIRSTYSEELPPQYQEFRDVFEQKEFEQLPDRRPWDHAINLVPGAESDRKLKGKVYPLSVAEEEALEEFIREHLKTGRIRPSQSPFGAPFFFVKKDGGQALRPVQDYRRLNEKTIRDSWPLPVIGDVLNKIKNAKVFSKFDVRWGFNNVRIKEGDEWKAAFITKHGLFEPTVMFFGLTNSPATFQHMMDDIFRDLINQGVLIVYIDDLLIFTETLEQHRKITQEVLKRLRKHKLFLKLSKCRFEASEVDFLGMVIKHGEITMAREKVQAVADWPTPKNLRDVRSFMQFCNFYRAFVPNFAELVIPLNELTKKGVPFEWTNEREMAMQSLKKAIAQDVVPSFPVPGAKLRLEVDASNYAMGAVLHQIVDGKPRPLGFFSKTMVPAERNYQIYDKEMLGLMRALEHWRHFLKNTPTQFDVWTDHSNLQYFREPQKLNLRQAGWYSTLADFNFKLHHRPG